LPHTLEGSASARAAALAAGAALADSTAALAAARRSDSALAGTCRALARSAASQVLSALIGPAAE
jgi:hypothetical protein